MEERKAYGVIYKITNLINGKIYIGQTIQESIEKRFNQHCYESSNTMLISRAIKKYGRENFIIEQICAAFSKDELNRFEEDYIKNLNSMKPNGYNIRPGGTNSPITEEHKNKIREGMRGRKQTKESLEKRSATRKGKKYPNISKGLQELKPRNSDIGKGITYKEKQGYYHAKIMIKTKILHLGCYIERIDALKAYDLAVILFRNGDGYINFPNEIDYNAFDKKIKREIKNTKNFQLQQQRQNFKRSSSTSKYKGVAWNKRDKKWRASLNLNKKTIYFNTFKSEIVAAVAYDFAVLKHIGENAYLNFKESIVLFELINKLL